MGSIHISSSKDVDKGLLRDVFLMAHPVGSYYWSKDPTSPQELFGGKWTNIAGRFIYAADTNHPVDSTGGEEKHVLLMSELPNISGAFGCAVPDNHVNTRSGVFNATTISNSYNATPNITVTTDTLWGYSINIGNNCCHNNMPPYLAAYCWQRDE